MSQAVVVETNNPNKPCQTPFTYRFSVGHVGIQFRVNREHGNIEFRDEIGIISPDS